MIRQAEAISPFPALMTAAEVAAALNSSERNVRRLNSAGHLPRPIKIGRLVRWRPDELRAWIDAGSPDRATWEAIRKRLPPKSNGRP
jgi:excisionase family DNA binding protein